MKITAQILIAMLLTTPSASAENDDTAFALTFFRAGWASIHPGIAGKNVLARLGQTAPQSEERIRILGIPVQKWRWRFDDEAFVITLAGPLARVIATKQCKGAPERC